MMEDLTAAQARAYDAWFETCWGAHAWAVELGAVDEALPDIADHIVVEIGCGTGRLVDHLASRGARVLGVDLSAGMLAVAAGRVAGRLVRGLLFTTARPGFLHRLEPLATLLGRITPRLGAVQVLTIDRAT